MRIALVSCCFEQGNLSYPLGALCIQSAIAAEPELEGHPVKHFSYICDQDDPEKAAAMVSQWKPDAVGLSVYLWNRSWLDRFARALKKASEAVTFAGGPDVTADYLSFDLNLFDFLCIGEGEEVNVRALIALSKGEKPSGSGIVSKDNPQFSYSFPAELGSVPSVLLSGVADEFLKKETTVLWEMTRGCPFGCDFCFESKGQRSVRHFDFERLEKELDVLIENKAKDIFVLDPTFNTDCNLTKKILGLLISKAPGWMHFSFEVRAELLDENLVQLFSRLFCSLQIGLQSIDPKVLGSIHRSFNEDVFLEKIGYLNKYGIVYGLDLIIGLPYDSFQQFSKSLDFAISCRPSNIDIFRLAVLPGTRLHDNAASFGIEYDKESPYLIKSSPTFTSRDLKLAERLKSACDLLYTKGEACMWFHSLCQACSMTPSEVLEHFWVFCPDCGKMEYEGDELYALQDGFVKSMLSESKQLLPALLSYIEFHQALAFLYDNDEQPVASLWFDPNTLRLLDDMDINDFCREHQPDRKPQNYLLYLDGNGDLMFEAVR
ncbi:MAG: B12-binding domain-containing radical SAM protein [Sphaerochaetaceae bacterium]|nr:B12-binding domain-containing radical SAM protein [Sphaerochaetaceae bacterium]